MAEMLRAMQINVSVSALPSARLDLGERGLQSLLRASVHYFNTENEVNRFARAVDEI